MNRESRQIGAGRLDSLGTFGFHSALKDVRHRARWLIGKETGMVALHEPQQETPERAYREFERRKELTERKARSMALQLTRNATDAEDLVQETFLKAWRGFGAYTPERPFLNWILRIMQRCFLDSRRRENPVRRPDSLNSMESPSDGEFQEIPIPDTSAGPDEELFRKEYARAVRRALDALPEPYRSAIMLCDLEGLSYLEIADAQQTSIGTVRSRIHRGRKILREIVRRQAPELVSR